ncbi:MAG: hypothetical protein ACI4FZ_10430 [Lachnospiraceae bacterium]
MAGSILNTLRYGNKKTRGLLYFLMGFGGLSILLGFLAFVFGNVVLGVLAATICFTDVLVLTKSNFSKTAVENRRKTKTAKEKKQKTNNRMPEETDHGAKEERGALEWISSEKEEKKEKIPEKQENPLLQYDEATMKKVFIAYKVRREHVPIMIDYCQAEQISQCPAYLWKDNVFLYFLLLEEEARMIKCPIADVDGIHIRRGIPAKPSAEYLDMQETSIVSRVFASYLPNYYRAETEGRRIEHRKNLYAMAPGIWCTAASVQNMLKILPSEFYLEEAKINSEDYSTYFRKIYIYRILYRDAVITAAEYSGKVQETLAALASADIADEVFHAYLAQMVMGSLIPQEYADFTMAKRARKKK